MCERCAELTEQVAYYRSELGLSCDATRQDLLRKRFGFTLSEAEIVDRLYSAKGRILKFDLLSDEIGISAESLRQHVCHIREKAGADFISTSAGVGYALSLTGLSSSLAALDPAPVAAMGLSR